MSNQKPYTDMNADEPAGATADLDREFVAEQVSAPKAKFFAGGNPAKEGEVRPFWFRRRWLVLLVSVLLLLTLLWAYAYAMIWTNTRFRAQREHGIPLPSSARDIQCRGDAYLPIPDRGALTLFEMDEAEMADFADQLQPAATITALVNAAPVDPLKSAQSWARTGRLSSFVPGNVRNSTLLQTWKGPAHPIKAFLNCRSPVGDWLHVEFYSIEDGVLVKMYTDWN